MNTEPILHINSPIVGQRTKAVLYDVDIKIDEGEFVYLIGKTGSGKSTLLRVLYADLPLNEGEGMVAGFDLRHLKEDNIPFLRRKLGCCVEGYGLGGRG